MPTPDIWGISRVYSNNYSIMHREYNESFLVFFSAEFMIFSLMRSIMELI